MATANASDYQEPDFKAIAQELKSKGLTYSDVKKGGSELLNTVPNTTLENPEGSRASEVDVGDKSRKGGTPESVKRLLQAYEGLETEGVVAQQGTQVNAPLDMFTSNNTLDLGSSFGDMARPAVAFNPEGASEMAMMTAKLLGQTVESLKEEYTQGISTGITFAKEMLNKAKTTNAISQVEAQIEEAQTPEEVAKILTDNKDVNRQPTSMLDFRQNFVVEFINPPSERVPLIAQTIVEDAIKAEETAKMQAKVWEDTNLLGVIADFGEIVLPTGVITEEQGKWDNGLDDALEKIRNAPREKQQEVFESIMESWVQTETFLIGNNNSLLIADQLQGLEDAIREGGLGFMNGDITEAEAVDKVETALNATIFGYEAKALGKGFKGIMKFMTSRIFPSNRTSTSLSKAERIPYTPFTDARNTITMNNPTGVKLIPNIRNVREELQEVASKKQPRLVRKTLEKEKKELGALQFSVENTSLNGAARELATKNKIKFKEALKIVNKEKQEQLDAIARRQDTVQELIQDFDVSKSAESQLSRLNQLVADGRMSSDELFKATGDYRVERVYDTRDSANVYDQVAKEKVAKFYQDVKDKGLKTVADDVGLSTEEMAARIMPTPSPTTQIGYPNISSQVNELILADEDVLVAGTKRALSLQRTTGGTLKLQESGTAIVENSDENSWGNFKFLFGDGEDGFKNSSEASKAMDKGLVGVDTKRVVERDGKWFVEVEQKHIFDPRLDVMGLNEDLSKVVNKNEMVFDPLRRLNEDVLKGVFALKGYNRSIATKMQSELESIFSKDSTFLAKIGLKPMDAEDTNALTKALEHTDQDDVDWITNIDDYARIADITTTKAQNTWSRYQRVQRLMEDVYNIRNEKYRRSLLSKGIKDAKVGDDVLRGSIESTSGGKSLFDPVTQRILREDELQETQAILKVQHPITNTEGDLVSFIAVNRVDVKELPAKVLSQRKGHIDRFYRDTGWTVKVKGSRVVDGDLQEYSSTTHIVKDQKEADKIAKDLFDETGEEAVVVRSRENDELDGIYGDESSVQYGYAGTHTKQRGGILKGSDGMDAPTSSMLESLSRTVGSIEKQLDVDIINSLRMRFLNQFQDYFEKKGGTPYSGRFEDMLDPSKVKSEVAEKAKQWHNYIEGISKIQQGEGFSAIDKTVKSFLKVGIDSQKLSSVAQNFTTQMVIVGRPLFQIPQNALQLTYVFEKYPVEALKSIPRLPSILSALNEATPDNITSVARAIGRSESEASALIREIGDSGLWDAVGMSDDFMRMVQKSSVDASRTRLGNAGNVAKNFMMSPFAASKAGQESVLKLVNLTSYLAEFEKQVLKGGRPFNAKTKSDMSFNVQKITQTQNSVNQFGYQFKSSLLSPMFQFTQHVHKLYLDVIVDPIMKLTKDPIMKALGKEVPDRVSPLAETHMKAATSLLATYAVFGPQGIFGNTLGSKVEDTINQIENPIAREVLQANILNEVINSTVNALGAEGQVGYSSKVHPASFIDTFYEYHIEGFFQEGTINVAGAVGYMAGILGDTGKALVAITSEPNLDWDEKASGIVSEVLRTVTGVSDFEKAYMAYHLGNYTYKSTLSGNLAVTPYEAIMQIGNFNPTAIQDRWAEFTSGAKGKESPVKGIAKIYSRLMHRELAEADNFEEMMVIGQKYSSMAQASVDPMQRQEVIKELSRSISEVGNMSYLDYIKPYMQQKKLSDVVFELKSLREDASTDKMRRAIDMQLEAISPMIDEIEKVYGK